MPVDTINRIDQFNLQVFGFKKNIDSVLNQAAARGIIGVREIMGLLPSSIITDKNKLNSGLFQLVSVLDALEVIVVKGNSLKKEKAQKLRKNQEDKDIEDKDIAKAFWAGRSLQKWISEIKRQFPVLPQTEIQKLSKRVREKGDIKARNTIVLHNLGLVFKFAYPHSSKYRRDCIEYADAIQEGTLGLIRAAEKFDERIGCNFSTYAVWWIKNTLQRKEYSDPNFIFIPVHIRELVAKINKVLKEKNDRSENLPSVEEIAKEIKKPVKAVEGILKKYPHPIILSLDSSLFENEDGEGVYLRNQIAQTQLASPRTLLDAKILLKRSVHVVKEFLREVFTAMKNDERILYVFYYRHCIGKRHTLKEIGKRLGVTRERVRQLELKAVKKIDKTSLNLKKFKREVDKIRILENLLEDIIDRRTYFPSKVAKWDKGYIPKPPIKPTKRSTNCLSN